MEKECGGDLHAQQHKQIKVKETYCQKIPQFCSITLSLVEHENNYGTNGAKAEERGASNNKDREATVVGSSPKASSTEDGLCKLPRNIKNTKNIQQKGETCPPTISFLKETVKCSKLIIEKSSSPRSHRRYSAEYVEKFLNKETMQNI